MLDLKWIRENSEQLKKAVEQKRSSLDVDELLRCDAQLMALKKNLQEYQTKRNLCSKKIPQVSAQERQALIEEGRKIGGPY